MNEGPVLLHVWDVDPAQDAADIAQLDALLREMVTDPGFVSARVLQSADRTSMAAIMEMRTVEDRQRMEQLANVRDTLDHLHGTANLVIRLYQQVDEYHA